MNQFILLSCYLTPWEFDTKKYRAHVMVLGPVFQYSIIWVPFHKSSATYKLPQYLIMLKLFIHNPFHFVTLSIIGVDKSIKMYLQYILTMI